MIQYLNCYCCPCKSWRLDLKSNKWEAGSGNHLFGNKGVFLSKWCSPLFVPARGNARGYGGKNCHSCYGVVEEPNVFGEDYGLLENRKAAWKSYRYWIQPPFNHLFGKK